MVFKNIFKLFLITIFVIGALNLSYADSNSKIDENQAKSISNEYLTSHGSPYMATNTTRMIEIKNKKTESIKWVSWLEWNNMAGGDKSKPEEDPNFQWKPTGGGMWNETWKVETADSKGNAAGSIWVNSTTGKVFKTEFIGCIPSNQTTNTTDFINQASPGPFVDNTRIIIHNCHSYCCMYWILDKK